MTYTYCQVWTTGGNLIVFQYKLLQIVKVQHTFRKITKLDGFLDQSNVKPGEHLTQQLRCILQVSFVTHVNE